MNQKKLKYSKKKETHAVNCLAIENIKNKIIISSLACYSEGFVLWIFLGRLSAYASTLRALRHNFSAMILIFKANYSNGPSCLDLSI